MDEQGKEGGVCQAAETARAKTLRQETGRCFCGNERRPAGWVSSVRERVVQGEAGEKAGPHRAGPCGLRTVGAPERFLARVVGGEMQD